MMYYSLWTTVILSDFSPVESRSLGLILQRYKFMAFHIESNPNAANSLSCNMKDTTTRICVLCVQRARQSRRAALVWELSHLLALFCQAAITMIAVRRCLVGHNAGTPKT